MLYKNGEEQHLRAENKNVLLLKAEDLFDILIRPFGIFRLNPKFS